MNSKLELQVLFMRNIAKLVEHANDLGYGIVLNDAHLDARCEYGHNKKLHSDRLALAFSLYRRTPDDRLDYFGLLEDHSLLAAFWKSLDSRCEFKKCTYSMPWKSMAE